MCRNADLVGMNDESQMHGNVASPGTYPTKSEVRARPNSGPAADDPYARPHDGLHGDTAAVVVTDGDNVPKPVRVTKPRRPKDRSGEGDISMSSTEDLTAPGEGEAAGQADTEKNAASKKRRRPKQTATQEESESLMSGDPSARQPADVPAVPPSPGEARRLKVHIKAQPGASVRIQNAPPPVAPKPAYRSKPHDTSVETDI